ncbi:DMT family transporter [Klenkia brasiliensis]|jgi:small multidrug resistance pump|uniref:Small multidrug resistance pump n=1 Tax=Klenkia brasiliensis TaxID=333142 RepID=A0A1G7SBU9_9ACTN|nr:SMR family transporter [Klenkia brasiliensis]SDG20461.1 small multidrug resistance pump [Klenkia brasiliensis]
MVTYGLLALAITVEIVATLFLRVTEGFTRLLPSLLVIVGYALSFFLLSHVLKRGLNVAVVYALWSAVAIVVISVIGAVFLNERLTAIQILGMALIVIGVLALEMGASTET